ncbi:transporter substrate-binding domain-containing protein [Simiduia curdlanivorans]|uniref:Substrate-binding periplasmic protein n=1 Tax=Simiduia curdlanivorans TaxID=1492769 RepID=A0ABV8V6J9_9GAMM|nr:transporter substrate-binding domain-containing protein [Simiduia curdlanivorans]MDN3638848.1 transporter substrate-binding domain-containing protein [Simiduia curdlanivorans]
MPWLVLLLIWVVTAEAASENRPRLILASDVYCPYTCDPSSGQEGYMVALTRGLLSEQNIAIEYVLTPWSRALQQMHTGQIDGIVGISQARAGDWLLSPPLGYDGITFFSLEPVLPQRLQASNLTWLDGLRLGHVAVRNPGQGTFDRYLEARGLSETPNIMALSGFNPVTSLLRMLHAGRIDVLADNAEVVRYTHRIIGLEGKLFSLGSLQTRALHLALAPTPENRLLMETFNTQLALWRSDGRLSALLAEYGLADWQAPEALVDEKKGRERP